MESINVKFLSKHLSLPTEIQEYMSILDITLNSHREMFDTFATHVLKTERKAIENTELLSILKPHAKKFVKLLCDKGIFTHTINDYITGIPAYTEVLETNQRALQATWDFLRKEILNYVQEVEDAERTAQSQVTGSNLRVWTNSFTTLTTFAALDYFTAKRQLRSASTAYQQKLKNISDNTENQIEKKTAQYVAEHYFPEMEQALGIFAFGMMDMYLSTLIKENQFDERTLQYVDIKKSNDLLDNLNFSSSSDGILESAFLACPFNLQTYIECTIRGKFNMDMFSFLSQIGKADEFKNSIKDIFSKLVTEATSSPTDRLPKILNKAQPLIEVLCLINSESSALYYQQLGNTAYQTVKDSYTTLKTYIEDEHSRYKWYDSFSKDYVLKLKKEHIHAQVEKFIHSISNHATTLALIETCGYTSLLSEIAPTDMSSSELIKDKIDEYYISKCANNLAEILPAVQKEIMDNNLLQAKKDARNQKIKEKGMRKKNFFKYFTFIVLASVYFFIVLFLEISLIGTILFALIPLVSYALILGEIYQKIDSNVKRKCDEPLRKSKKSK